ncbi:MAG: hypothetical protein AB1589_44120, partial [Cyanobacteriota bacterium]
MPYALNYTTLTNKYVSFPTLSIANGETFSIECVASIDATGAVRLIANPSGTFTGRVILQQSATPNVRITTTEGVAADWNYSFVIGTYYKIRIVRTGTVGELFINDVSQGTRTLNGSFSFSWFFAQSTTFGSSCTVRYIEFVSNAGTRLYRNDSSTGTVWPDVNNSANNATQQGTWPTNNSEWVFYSSGGGSSWEGTIGKTSLSAVNKSLSINTGQLLSPDKTTITLSSKQQSISTGFIATNGKASLTLSPKQETINVGYINTLSKLGLALLQKQLSITVGANLSFTGVIGKTTYALNGKQ